MGETLLPRLSLKQRLMPTRSSTTSCLVPPADSASFNFKPGVINLLPSFHGLERENPYTHIREFEDVCTTCRDGKTSNETIHLNLFPFSLKDRAKVWLNSQPPNSITTWLDLQAEFLTKFFPLHRTQASKSKFPTSLKSRMNLSIKCGSDSRNFLGHVLIMDSRCVGPLDSSTMVSHSTQDNSSK